MSDDRKKLYDIIDDVEIAMLTTVEAGGKLHTRPMKNQKADRSGTVWFFTEKDSAVARDVAENGNVSLGYAGKSEYVSANGTGAVVNDRAKIDALWSDVLKAWFPKGKDDPDLVLLRVDLEEGEFWTFPSSTLTQAVGYVRARLSGERADDIGENRKVAL